MFLKNATLINHLGGGLGIGDGFRSLGDSRPLWAPLAAGHSFTLIKINRFQQRCFSSRISIKKMLQVETFCHLQYQVRGSGSAIHFGGLDSDP
jgi:hypothetical protein